MPLTTLRINEVNNIISEHFIKIFGNVVEHCPAAAIGILKYRPFDRADDLSKAINNFLDKLTPAEKHNILTFYPDVVGKLCDFSHLTLIFEQHQRISGSEHLTLEDKQRLNQLNKRYMQKFGFPFITYTKVHKDVFTIFSEIEERIENDETHEAELAIGEVKRIAKLRICEILQP